MKRKERELLREAGYKFADDWDIIDDHGKHYVVYWNLPKRSKLIKNLVRCTIFNWTFTHGAVRKWHWTTFEGQPALLVPKSFIYLNKLLLGRKQELNELFLTRVLEKSWL